jgi:amidase
MIRTIRQHLIAYGDGWLSPVETVAGALSAIDQMNPVLNALPTLRERSDVLADAEQISARLSLGDPVGQLAGMPYCAKDTHRTAGLKTTFGSPIFAEHVPTENEPIVQRLLDADANLVAKSNTPEFAAGSQTFNTLFGTTRNPYSLAHTSGGSSGGSACALASGMVWVADGSDLASSLRNPASFCGVVGMRASSKPDPLLRPGANGFSSLSMPGPLARGVDDLRLSYRSIFTPTGKRPIKEWCDALSEESQYKKRGILRYERAGALPREPRSLRIAWTVDGDGRIPVDPAVHRALRRATHILQEAGITLIQATPDLAGADECFQTLRGLYFVENFAALYWSDQHRMKDTVVWNIEFGLDLTAERIAAANRLRTEIFQRMRRFMGDIDAWILPTAQVLPFSHDLPYPTSINGEALGTYIDWLKSCYWVSVSGHPAISLPCGFERDDAGIALPAGLQLVGRWDEDEALLDVAETIETLLEPLNSSKPPFASNSTAELLG